MGRLLLAIVLTMAGAQLAVGSIWRVAAQDSGAQVVIERPLPGTSISVQAAISGWAVDPSGSGTGVDAVHVYLDGEPGQPRARFLGQASYGQQRPDVARTLGEARFTTSGFALLTELPPGTHSLFVYAHSAGAGPQEGWSRASVASFETSLIEAVATMVQPGPTPAGDTSRYQTGQASWQGGNTCVRYTGAGSCEASIPVGVASGSACIQWNQRGQCTNYVGGADVIPGSGNSAPPAASVRSVPPGGPPSVPTVAASGARPPAGAPRAVAPPAEGDGDAGAAAAGPPSGAVPAAAPPGAASEGEDSAPVVRVAAPPPAAPTAVGAVRTNSAGGGSATGSAAAAAMGSAPPSLRSSGAAAAAAPTAVIVLTPPDASGLINNAPDEAFPADAPPPVADFPGVRATAAALQANNASAGIAPLRSGCALYIGCGGDTTASAPVATRVPVPTSAPIAAIPAPAAGLVNPAPAPAAGLLNPGLPPSPTPTPTSTCPPFGGCAPLGR